MSKKVVRGDTAELATKKRSPGFSGKNRGVTPSVAAPGVTHPSDATAVSVILRFNYEAHDIYKLNDN